MGTVLKFKTREPSPKSLASPDKETIRGIFDSIAFRYDALNSLLSLSIDERWRKRAVELILRDSREAQSILDLGVGTGKFLSRFIQKKSWQRAVGLDFSGEMLRRARAKLPASCELLQADIHELPFEDEAFDLVVSSFTLRSVKERSQFFKEVYRILGPGGKTGFICLTRPTSFWGRTLYAPYLRIYLPLVGGLLTRDPIAYRFLSESIQSFPSFHEISLEMQTAGFRNPQIVPFTLGISTLLIIEK